MASIQKRQSKDGKTSYRVQVRRKGSPPMYATFERKTDAERWAADREGDIRQGRHFRYARARRHTVADLIDHYLTDVIPRKPKSAETQIPQLRWWRDQLGAYLVSDLDVSHVASARDRLVREENRHGRPNTPATANRYVAALRHAFNVAIDEWGWLDASPVAKLKKLSEPEGRVRFLSEDERVRLLGACRDSDSPHLYPIVVLALSTGMRKANVVSLRWSQVDLDRSRITLDETKSGRRLGVPLTGHARDLLADLHVRRDPDIAWVFPGPNGKPIDIRTAWETARRKAGIEDFRFHDLRHTAASYLAMNGATTREIAEVLGHSTLEMVKRYSHLADDHVSGVVGRMTDRMFGDD